MGTNARDIDSDKLIDFDYFFIKCKAQGFIVLPYSQIFSKRINIMLKKEKNISKNDLYLFSIVDTPSEAVKIIVEFYNKYTLQSNF